MNSKVSIIAGPCSINKINIDEVFQIARMADIAGVRVVGTKSRTALEKSSEAMGMDYDAMMKNLISGSNEEMLPSIEIAAKIIKETGKLVATEIVSPHIQMKLFAKANIPAKKLLAWNPAPNQLGWSLLETAIYASKNDWYVGIKNPKWCGDEHGIIEGPEYLSESGFEKQWLGGYSYASGGVKSENVIMIHRGVDVPQKGNFRSALVHQTVLRIKKKNPNVNIFFDPSHSYGPKLKPEIVKGTIEAMKMKIESGEYLYNGILIEVGHSTTDTDQHISIEELETLIKEIKEFREISNEI